MLGKVENYLLDTSAYKFLLNTGVSTLTTLLNVVMGFWILAVAKDSLGDIGLGVWALGMSFTAMAALVDFGLGPALGILVAKYAGQGDTEKIEESVNAFVLVAVPLAVAIVIFGLLASPKLAEILVNDKVWNNEASSLFALMFMMVAIRLIGSLLGGVLIGYQMIGQFKLWLALWAFMRSVGILWLFKLGFHLGLVGSWMVLTTVGGLCTITLLWYKVLPLRIVLGCPSKKGVQELWTVALSLQTARMAGALIGQVDKLILAGLIGAVYAGWYELASKLAGSVLLLPGFMLVALAPLVSAMVGQGESARVQRLLYFTTRYLNIAVFGMAGFLFLYADSLLLWWLGSIEAEVVLATRVMIAVFLVMAIQQPYIDHLLGLGNKSIIMRFSLVVLLGNIPLSLALVNMLGFSGSYWATLIMVALASIFFFAKALEQLGISWVDWRKQWFAPCCASVLTMLILYPFALTPHTLSWGLVALLLWVILFSVGLLIFRGFGMSDVKMLLRTLGNK